MRDKDQNKENISSLEKTETITGRRKYYLETIINIFRETCEDMALMRKESAMMKIYHMVRNSWKLKNLLAEIF